MKILFFCPRWGQEQVEWDVFLQKVKNAGYDGVEASLPFDENDKAAILNSLQKHGLQFIAQHYETVDKDFNVHLRQFERRLMNLASARPLFINTQTGKDYYTFEQNEQLIALARKISTETGEKIVHEPQRDMFVLPP